MIVGSCAQRCEAARERCCPCEGGSRRQVLEGGGVLKTAAETLKTDQDQRSAAMQDGIPAKGGDIQY